MRVSACYACEQDVTGGGPERLWADDVWRVAHAFDTALPGWLVVLPRRHVRGLHELGSGEAARLGELLRAVSTALVEVTGCVKTYVMLFAEAEGFEHLHVHVVPRHADLPAEHRGPRVFAYLGVPPERQVPQEEQTALAARLGRAVTLALGHGPSEG